MIRYGKLVDGHIEYAPKHMIVDGRVVINPLPPQLRAAGFKAVLDRPCPAGHPAGMVWEDRGWVGGDTAITRKWKLVKAPPAPPPPPRTFRRSWLAQWLRTHGKWDAFKALLSQSLDLEFFWETSTEFDEDHPMWDGAMAGMKAALQLTDSDVREFLEYGATGREPDTE